MGFAFPLFMWSLALIAIPIIIHLFYFRRYKKIYFSSIRFLKEVKEQQKKAGRLQQLMILASRILAIVFLVLAFAQPFLGRKDKKEGFSARSVILYIDNTFSMHLGANGRDVLTEAKELATAVLEGLHSGDKVILLTNDLDGQLQRWMAPSEAIERLTEISISPSANEWEVISNRINTLFKDAPYPENELYYLSDFQSYSLPEKWTDTTFQTFLLPLTADVQSNIYIDSCWLADPVVYRQAINKMVVKVNNNGKAVSTRLTLQLDGEVKAMADIDLPENGSTTDTLLFSLKNAGWQKGMLAIQDYPVTFDDRLYFSFESASSNKVLLLEEVSSGRAVYNVFQSDAHFATDKIEANRLDFSTLTAYSLVVVNELKNISPGMAQALNQYVQKGGSLYIVPSEESNLIGYNTLLQSLGTGILSPKIIAKASVSTLNDQEPILKAAFDKIPRNIDLPEVKRFYPISSASKSVEKSVMRLNNGRPFIQSYATGTGVVYLQASSLQLSSTDFSAKAIFPPLIYNMAVFKANPKPLYYTAAQNQLIQGIPSETGSDQIVKLKSGNYEIIPPIKPSGSQLSVVIPQDNFQDGVFDVVRAENILSSAAINYSRKESDMRFTTNAQLNERYSGPFVEVTDIAAIYRSSGVSGLGKNMPLWKVFLILALLFLLAEVLLIRFATPKTTE